MAKTVHRAAAQQIRAFLEREGLTQRELAELAGVQPVTVSRWVNGHNLPYARKWRELQHQIERRLHGERPNGWAQLLVSASTRARLGVDSELLALLQEKAPELFEHPYTLQQLETLFVGLRLGRELERTRP